MRSFVPVGFLLLLVLAFLSILAELIMRIRLTRLEIRSEKLLWWRRGGDDVTAAYEELFPGSCLPHFRQVAFWLVILSAFLVFFAFVVDRLAPSP